MKNKIFLGGTCANTTWREEIIQNLSLEVSFFNPVVEDWTPECQEEERLEKELECNVHLYVITKEMMGVFSIAEVIDSVKTPGKLTILNVAPEGFSQQQTHSLEAVCNMVQLNGGIAIMSVGFDRLLSVLNNI